MGEGSEGGGKLRAKVNAPRGPGPGYDARVATATMLAGALITACASVPTVTARHAPFFLEANHASQIVASARSESGLDYIQILVTAGDVVSCHGDGDLPSAIPCRANASTTSRACFFYQGETTGTCTFPQQIAAHTMVTYSVNVKDRAGRMAAQDPVTYSGGQRPQEIYCSFLWGFIPVLECTNFEPLMPIWWEIQNPAGGSTAPDQVDVGLFEDADNNQTAQVYSGMIEPIIRNVFFNPGVGFADDWTYARKSFTLWSAPDGADGDNCTSSSWSFAGVAGVAATYTDAEVIFHTDATQPRGCARLSFGGPSWEWVNHPSAAEKFIHEKGHSLAGLGDEYCCDGGYSSISIPNNVHATKQACDAVANQLGVATSLCVAITNPTTNQTHWRITNGQLELMSEDQNQQSDWRDASDRAQRRLLSRCAAGSCF